MASMQGPKAFPRGIPASVIHEEQTDILGQAVQVIQQDAAGLLHHQLLVVTGKNDINHFCRFVCALVVSLIGFLL